MPSSPPNRLFLLVPALLMAGCTPARLPWTLPPGGRSAPVSAGEVSSPGEDDPGSRVLVRRVARPTRANLDWAAYHHNPMLCDSAPEGPPARAACLPDDTALFAGVLVPGSISASPADMPLDAEERARPLAFSPLVDALARWDYEKIALLEEARAAVRAESWGLPPSVQITYQEIVAAWLHGDALWVEIEFRPWVRLFEEMPDADGDGRAELFARLDTGPLEPAVFARIRDDYAGRVLAPAEVRGWANELASYWYPSYNTDVVDLAGASSWPPAEPAAEVAEVVQGRIENPTVVIRGKPQGRAIFNVFVVEGMPAAALSPGPKDTKTKTAAPVAGRGPQDVSPDPGPLRDRLMAERDRRGSWEKWIASVAPHHRRIRRMLRKRPGKLKALVGRKGFLFFRDSLACLVGGDPREQQEGKNPYPAIVVFRDHLAERGVDFLLVPVPAKPEVFPDRLLPGRFALDELPVLNPHGRKFLFELAEAGVEVIDLLPAFLDARARRGPDEELVYQHQDTHWTDRGLRLAAGIIAERIERYPWYAGLAADKVAFGTKEVTFNHQGDLVSRLAPREQTRYKPVTLKARQVLMPDGSLYQDDMQSPVVVLGDSFTGVYQLTGPRAAGVTAHIARELGIPVDLVMSWGGGPGVRKTLLRRGDDDLRKRRLVVWIFAARDFIDYWDTWDVIE